MNILCKLYILYINKANSLSFYPPTKDYFTEKSKSQNMNPISPTLKFILNIIRIITRACELCFSTNMLRSIKILYKYYIRCMGDSRKYHPSKYDYQPRLRLG